MNLRCRIERTNCFIEQNEAGLQSDGAGNAHALELAARKLMRIAGEKAFVEADPFKQFNGFLALSFSADDSPFEAQGAEGFSNNALNAKARIGRSGVILKNDGDARLNARSVGARQPPVEIESVETNRAGVGRKQSAEDAPEGRFARTRFADDAEAFAFLEIDRKAVEHFLTFTAEEPRLIFLAE